MLSEPLPHKVSERDVPANIRANWKSIVAEYSENSLDVELMNPMEGPPSRPSLPVVRGVKDLPKSPYQPLNDFPRRCFRNL